MFVTEAFAQTEPAPAVAAEAAHATGVFPPFDFSTYPSQLLWLAISFGAFYWIMKNVIVPRLGGIVEARHDRIAQDLDEAARLKAEADAAVEAYEQDLAAARNRAGEIAGAARDEARASAGADRAAIEAELAEKLAAAETRIAAIRADAFANVGEIAEQAAGQLVGQLIGKDVSAEEIRQAISNRTGA